MVVLEGDFFSPASRDSDATTPPESGNADVDVPFKSNPFNTLPKCKGRRTHKHRLRLKAYTYPSVFRSQKDMTKWPIGHSLVNGFFSLNLSWIWWYLIISDLSKLSWDRWGWCIESAKVYKISWESLLGVTVLRRKESTTCHALKSLCNTFCKLIAFCIILSCFVFQITGLMGAMSVQSNTLIVVLQKGMGKRCA